MSERYVEKSFLALLTLSLLLHCGAMALLYLWSQQTPPPPKEPVFIDLQQMPDLPQQQAPSKTERLAEQRVRVPRETAPRGVDNRDLGTRPPVMSRTQPAPAQPGQKGTAPPLPAAPSRSETPGELGPSAASLLRKKPATTQSAPQPQLFPAASRMAKLEENYRRKFERDIEEGDTRFLDSNDVQFGSFLRRFENSVYGVWHYPQEAAMKGIEGIVPVRITFNRKGEIVNILQLESSGARILDEEVIRTLRAVGPVGSFPKGYDKDQFHLIAFFQYGGSRRRMR